MAAHMVVTRFFVYGNVHGGVHGDGDHAAVWVMELLAMFMVTSMATFRLVSIARCTAASPAAVIPGNNPGRPVC
jgi:hypothetical protein